MFDQCPVWEWAIQVLLLPQWGRPRRQKVGAASHQYSFPGAWMLAVIGTSVNSGCLKPGYSLIKVEDHRPISFPLPRPLIIAVNHCVSRLISPWEVFLIIKAIYGHYKKSMEASKGKSATCPPHFQPPPALAEVASVGCHTMLGLFLWFLSYSLDYEVIVGKYYASLIFFVSLPSAT